MAAIKAEIAGKILTLLGYDGTDFYNLTVDAAGHLQVDCVSSALPAGAATEEKQDTEIATLELIALIRNALQSVDTDKLLVSVDESVLPAGAATSANQATLLGKIKDQIITYKSPLLIGLYDQVPVSGNLMMVTGTVPEGEVWVVETMTAFNLSGGTGPLSIDIFKTGDTIYVDYRPDITAKLAIQWLGTVMVPEGYCLRGGFYGCTQDDWCYFTVFGYRMSVEV